MNKIAVKSWTRYEDRMKYCSQCGAKVVGRIPAGFMELEETMLEEAGARVAVSELYGF